MCVACCKGRGRKSPTTAEGPAESRRDSAAAAANTTNTTTATTAAVASATAIASAVHALRFRRGVFVLVVSNGRL